MTTQQQQAYDNLAVHNRDVIRRAAKAAGVVNVTYKSKDENIAELIARGVTDVIDGGTPVYGPAAAVEPEPVWEGVEHEDDEDELVFHEDEVEALHAEAAERDAATEVPPHTISIDNSGRSVITLVVDGNLVSVNSDDGRYTAVATALLTGEDPTPFLDANGLQNAAAEAFANELLKVEGDVVLAREDGKAVVYVGGERVDHPRLSEVVVDYYLSGRPFLPLVRFLQRASENPYPLAETRLLDFASNERYRLTEEGYLIGFKSFARNADGSLRPSTSGYCIVNGERQEAGHVSIRIGDVVTMDPEDVKPGSTCGVGLHVGSWSYASTFNVGGGDAAGYGNVKTEVLVDPAKIVNVPGSEGKLRCTEYRLVKVHEGTGVSAQEVAPTFDRIETAAKAFEDALDAQSAQPEAVAYHDGEVHYEPVAAPIVQPDPAPAKGWFRRLFTGKG